ncbi:MAG: TetR/AcrR family transcriptional regulator [Planctomycetota bacterium]|nr:TetR/AcrR family transcriptional regulator [Planctomycetota bacterium]
MKRSSEQTRGERTRQAILASATQAFRDRGYERATTADVAQGAKVSEATIFNHYGSKSGLLLEVMESYYRDTLLELEEAIRGQGGPEQQLRVMVRFWVLRVVKDWSLARVFSQHGRFSDDPQVVTSYRELSRGLTGRVLAVLQNLRTEGKIGDDIPLYLLRDVIFGAGEHIALGAAIRPRSQAELERAGEQIVGLILAGSKPSEKSEASLASLEAKLDQVLQRLPEA